MIIINVIMSCIMLLVVPFCIGELVVSRLDENVRSIGLVIPVGYITELAVFELVTVPILLLTQYQNFKYVLWIYTPILLALSILGVISVYREYKASPDKRMGYLSKVCIDYIPKTIDAKIVWIVVVIILVVMLIMAETRVVFDGDDAFYVTQSLITAEQGTMYASQPYTGRAASVDIRHAMAVFTMWIAYIGKTTGLHTTIVCHTVLPLVLIPLSLISYTEIGLRLLGEKRDILPYFTLFIELLMVFGRVSIYTSETFLLTRTWQGKSMAANFLIPMTFLAMYIAFSSEKTKSRWGLALLINTVAGLFSSLAIVLISILILVCGFVLAINDRKVRRLIEAGCCCIPGGIYMILYLYFTYFGWR